MKKIKVEDLNKDFPKAMEKFKEWLKPLYFEKMDEDIIKQYGDNLVDVVISHSTRMLYDFFDAQKIFISIRCDYEKDWNWDIIGEDQNLIDEKISQDSRPKAEQEAFIRAFKILNEKL